MQLLVLSTRRFESVCKNLTKLYKVAVQVLSIVTELIGEEKREELYHY